ncbi:MAG: hypothetical protein Q4G35_04745 [Propionibacteriaceae bacterium]|nr:hypothetical protein [Propionibacteriaceae bacterium]
MQPTALVLDGCQHELDDLGVALMRRVSRRLRAHFGQTPCPRPIPEGPHFVYENAPHLFGQRTGRGPLHVMLDTNVFLDLADRARSIWLEDIEVDSKYGEELEALQLFMGLWVIRDIRLHLPEALRWDSRSILSEKRRAERRRAIREFDLALQLVGEFDVNRQDRIGAYRVLNRLLERVPAGGDRSIAREAMNSGMHVVLTRDEGFLKAKASLRVVGIMVASPQDLLEMLVAAGAFHCLLRPECAYWPLPDQHRTSHLARLAQMMV